MSERPTSDEEAIRAMHEWNAGIIAEFRANSGKVGGPFEGAPVLLLHTIGAKTGAERVNPTMYQRVGEEVAVFASKGGAPTNPDWYHNLVANPEVTVELGEETVSMVARVVGSEERAGIWERQKKEF